MADEILAKLLASKKYASVCPDTVRRVLDMCARKYKKPKDIEKAAKENLHGITGAFLTPSDYKELCKIAPSLADGDDKLLFRALSMHASTRERLPLDKTDVLYSKIFEITGKPSSIVDLACGLNPLYLWARFAKDNCRVTGVDISGDCISLLNSLAQSAVQGICADLLCENSLPAGHFDIALLFKVLPLLEREKAGSAAALLESIDAGHIVVSFPTRTLTGRNVGMEKNYALWMEEHMPGTLREKARFSTENELFFILCPEK